MLPGATLAASKHGLSMNYTTDFKSIRAEVSAEEWQARVDLSARPYGVLEWPAMLRLLEAEDRHSGYPPYWH
jgi:hypothetical protein